MAQDDREFEHESLEDRASIVRYLKAITDGFDNGSLSLASRNGEILLEPRGLTELAVKTSFKHGRMRLTLQATWKTAESSGDKNGGRLSITANRN
jgi:amphi-Trp domain-containing protein